MKLTVTIAAFLTLAATLPANPPFEPDVHAAGYGDTINMGETAMAMFGHNFYTISNTNERGTYPVCPFGRSADGGRTWLPTLGFRDASVGIDWHSDPALVCDAQGNLHMAVQFSTTVTRHYLSTDGGVTWCDSADITDRSTGGAVDKDWMIYDRGNLYVTWQEINSGSEQGIRFAKSTDGGASWTRQTIVPGGSGITTLCTDANGVIYLVYGWNSLYFMKSTNQGAAWSSPVFLNNVTYSTGYGDRAPMPCLTTTPSGILFLAWTDNSSGNWDVLYRRSTNGGTNWTSTATLNDSTVGGQFKVWLCPDPYGGIHAFYYHTPSWPTSASSRFSIRYNYSPDGGATIRPSIRMSDTTFTSPVTFLGEYHNIVCDSQRIYGEWTDGRNGHNNELYFTQALLSELGVEQALSPVPTGPVLDLPAVFSRAAELVVNLEQRRNVSLAVFDASGRIVKAVHQGILPAGRNTFWLSDLPANRALFARASGELNAARKFIVLP
jgi:hypothetical protein